MERSSPICLTTQDGFRGTLSSASFPLNQDANVPVHFENGTRVAIPAALLQRREDGSLFLPMRLAEIQNLWLTPERQTRVIPVVEEKLALRKRRVETGRVRITKKVSVHQENIDDSRWQDTVQVERVAVNRLLEGPVEVRQEGETLIIPVLEETLVVEKRLVLKEELRITRHRVESHQPRQVTLRREEVVVERVGEGEVELESR